jgi:hypothetical protein
MSKQYFQGWGPQINMAEGTYASSSYSEPHTVEKVTRSDHGLTQPPSDHNASSALYRNLEWSKAPLNSDYNSMIVDPTAMNSIASPHLATTPTRNGPSSVSRPNSELLQQPLHSVGFGSAQRSKFVGTSSLI